MQSKLVPVLAAATLAASIGNAVAFPGYATVPANLRSGPGIDFPPVATVTPQVPLDVIDCGGGWCRVQAAGAAGYVWAPLVASGLPPLDFLASPFGLFAPAPVVATTPAPVVAAY